MRVVTPTFFLFALLLTACSGTPSSNADPHAGMNHNTTPAVGDSTTDHSKMDHSKMDHSKMESSPGANDAPYDLQWIDTMIAHHEGAMAMAAPAYKNAKTLEMTRFAEQMQRDQQKEIATMKQWRVQRFRNAKPAINMDMPGMSASMKGMDMAKLEAAKGVDFDLEFIRQMVPHHEGALTMSKDAIAKSENDDLKKLAREIIKAQEAEIKQMREWAAKWSKK
ncbi:MAG TPA: DUF305 domain-containing protein [Pyrinomonadaceae bacterium]|nr:DUF305 domain-containing protein [Pyrinomonadaceae bacterium]